MGPAFIRDLELFYSNNGDTRMLPKLKLTNLTEKTYVFDPKDFEQVEPEVVIHFNCIGHQGSQHEVEIVIPFKEEGSINLFFEKTCP